MDFFAFLAVLVGAYLIDSVVKGRPPITTIRRILENPDKVTEILNESRDTAAKLPTSSANESRDTAAKLPTSSATSSATGGGGESVPVPTSGGRVEPNAKGFAGVNAEFLTRVQAWAAETGDVYKVTGNGGFRTRADQQTAYHKYKAGKGPLAAKPGSSAHESGNALDVRPHPSAKAVALMPKYGLGLTVKGEPWHIGNLRK